MIVEFVVTFPDGSKPHYSVCIREKGGIFPLVSGLDDILLGERRLKGSKIPVLGPSRSADADTGWKIVGCSKKGIANRREGCVGQRNLSACNYCKQVK